MLPPVLRDFVARYPKVKLELHQGNPTQVAEHTARGDADVGIATEALATYPRSRHPPLLSVEPMRAGPARSSAREGASRSRSHALARHPIITYDFKFTGRSQINAAFDAAGLVPNVVLTALDSDVIKTYVEMGLGVGIIAKMAWDPARDAGVFEQLDAAHLFAPSITRLALRRGTFLRGYVYDFIAGFAPALEPGGGRRRPRGERTRRPR